jgi:hypothetical protein
MIRDRYVLLVGYASVLLGLLSIVLGAGLR